MAKLKFFGSVDMSSTKVERIHIAIPNSLQMLVDQPLDMGILRVGLIEGNYTKTIETTPLTETQFGVKTTRAIEEHRIKWGKKDCAYNKTVTLQEIYDGEGPFIITHMIVQFPYPEDVAVYGVPQKITSIAHHEFRKWPFKPGLFKQLFDRMPSHPLYQMLLRTKRKWAKKSGDTESLRRMRDTWLINRPTETLPINVYKLWYGKGAMILPEKLGTFVGRELGVEYEGVF